MESAVIIECQEGEVAELPTILLPAGNFFPGACLGVLGKFVEKCRSYGSGRGRSSPGHERIGKKYQWLAFYELLARVADNFDKYDRWGFSEAEIEPYEDPRNPYVRDIDPTMMIKKIGNSDEALYLQEYGASCH
jgi:hypothetical protein